MELGVPQAKLIKGFFLRSMFQYGFILCTSYIISLVLVGSVWEKHNAAIHSLMELGCIIVAFTCFLIVWVRYNENSIRNQIAAYGFLITAVFDIFHTYYYPVFAFYPEGYYDLATRFWILGRLTEAFVLLFVTFEFKKERLEQKKSLLFSIVFTGGLSYLVICHPSLFPVLYTQQGCTPIKILLECVISIISLTALWNLRNKLFTKNTFDFRYIFMSIILFATSEMFFTVNTTLYNPEFICGHLLKLISYYFIFKGVIEIEINAPYIKLEQANKRLADILNAVPIGISTFNDALTIDFTNRKFEEMADCKKEDLIGLSGSKLKVLFKKDSNSDSKPSMQNASSEKESSAGKIGTYVNLKGETLKVFTKTHKLENGVAVIIEDVKKMQEIDNLHLQTKTILSSISSPAAIADASGTITLCNEAFEELVEINRDLLIGVKIETLYKRLNFCKKSSNNESASKTSFDGIFYGSITTPAGTQKEVTVNISSILNIDNEVIGLTALLKDITAEKSNQQKLINQEKLALLGQMGASIVHETRNFLTTIMGCSLLIHQSSSDTKVQNYAKKIYKDILEVNRIISDFLTLSKPREVLMDEVAINDLLTSMQSTLETSSLLKGVNVNLSLQDIERYVNCDEAMIKQVILNMCKNAVEAMADTPDPLLTISTALIEETEEILIKIADNGKGISKENLSKIGHAFFTTKSNGTGLGLNVCYQIIKEHHGKIEVTSELGKGTTFTIVLPCINDEAEDLFEGETYTEDYMEKVV